MMLWQQLQFFIKIEKIESINIIKISDLETLINKDEIHKFGHTYHFNILVKNKAGLKNLFKIISLANTKHFYKTARILRSEVEELRDGLLIGSGCYESEVFIEARSKTDEELRDIIGFYDYVEVQPPECYSHLIQMGDFKDETELINNIQKIIRLVKRAGKVIVATGDVHISEEKIKYIEKLLLIRNYQVEDYILQQSVILHQFLVNIFEQLRKCLKIFRFQIRFKRRIVITNTNKIADLIEEVEVIY